MACCLAEMDAVILHSPSGSVYLDRHEGLSLLTRERGNVFVFGERDRGEKRKWKIKSLVKYLIKRNFQKEDIKCMQDLKV